MWDKLLLSLAPGKPDDNQSEDTGSEDASETRQLKLRRISHYVNTPMWKEAKVSKNQHYRQDIEASVPEKLESFECGSVDYDKVLLHQTSRDWYYPERKFGSCSVWLNMVDPVNFTTGPGDRYDGVAIDIPSIDFAVFARDVVGVDNDVWKSHKNGRLDFDEVYELLDASDIGIHSTSHP
ncbi:hypothetical protein N7456_002089 [Penicillium angulare]|uniref:Uncharacterized protein n=1 Tax=Penicillium angulare TaxID=116970 RepID=A0A9W9G8H6_9EURO|nr:hypothetical protein N7456_002089 [Penicillium angulare]